MLKRGDFEVAMDFQCGFIVEPDLDLPRFLSTSDANYGKHKDTVIDDLFSRSRGGRPTPRSARSSCAQFEKRLLDEEVHVHLHAAVAPDHPAQRQGEGLDDHAEPLPEQPARHGLARGVGDGDGGRRAAPAGSEGACGSTCSSGSC